MNRFARPAFSGVCHVYAGSCVYLPNESLYLVARSPLTEISWWFRSHHSVTCGCTNITHHEIPCCALWARDCSLILIIILCIHHSISNDTMMSYKTKYTRIFKHLLNHLWQMFIYVCYYIEVIRNDQKGGLKFPMNIYVWHLVYIWVWRPYGDVCAAFCVTLRCVTLT